MVIKDILFSPFKIKSHDLKNRIGVAPMTRMSSVKDSVPRQDVLEFLVRRAENGAAIVYTEAIVTDYESAQGYPGQARMLTQRQIDAWKPVVKAIQDNGAIAIMQMFHCGRVAWEEINPAGRVIAPSPIRPEQDNRLTKKPYPIPDEMTQFDIDHVITGFVETAKGAVAAGFDGIEIHGAHGYLINSFLSAYANQRTDAYGGTIENRFRFAKEVIRAVHDVVPEDRLLTFRISNWGVVDMQVSLFENKGEWQELIKRLSEEPVDAISVSTYRYKDNAFGTNQTMAEITREVTDLPLMICGQIFDRTSAEDALRHADIVLSAKSILLNPNWVEDVRSGKDLPLHERQEANVAYTEQPLP
jgi:2,4-dienoyl-CoA reductase-like NADH-dependent reductase (Old Yellow Enzyme family)